MKPRQIKLERTFRASADDVWELWTTKDGIESWWGPEGFRVQVHALDLRVGGVLLYSMIASAPEQVAFMKREGMPIAHEARITFTEVARPHRLAYRHDVDFVPNVAAYDIATLVEINATADGVRLTLTSDAMHDDEWTRRATMGWESELGKLATRLASQERDT